MRLSILRRGLRLALIPHRRLRASLNVWGQRRQAQHTLMAFLIGIALADGTFSEAEREALYQVAALLSLPQREVDQLISMANAQAQFQERYFLAVGLSALRAE